MHLFVFIWVVNTFCFLVLIRKTPKMRGKPEIFQFQTAFGKRIFKQVLIRLGSNNKLPDVGED